MANKRLRLKADEADYLNLQKDKGNRYTLNKAQLLRLKEYREENGGALNIFEQTLEEHNFKNTPWKDGWLKTKTASIRLKNPDLELSFEQVQDEFRNIVEDLPEISLPPVVAKTDKALRVVISDAHIGMNSKSEEALFSFDYNEDVLNKHLDIVRQKVLQRIQYNGPYDLIIIDDLGDGLDGFNKQTTRGGHELEQNMTNKQAWSAYVKGKISLIQSIMAMEGAERYELRSAANSNHGGDFEWTANIAIKMLLEKLYGNVNYRVMSRSAEHFEYGAHTFILTHGKDMGLMKKNWPLNLTPQVANLIRQYIDHYGISSKYIHVDKGDLHQVGYNREPRFDYRNFMSFAPPSQWIQANFGVSYCGFSIQEIPKYINEIEHTDYFFDLK